MSADREANEGDEDRKYVLPTDYGIEVYRTVKDLVAIRQDGQFQDDEALILVSPERVEHLIRYLRAVKDDIMTDRADAAEARATELPPPLSNG